MRAFHALFAGAIVAVVAAPTLVHATTVAVQSYLFTGQCTDCTGTGIGTLNLTGYTEGTSFLRSNFVSFTYSSNLVPSFEITSDNLGSIFGSLGPTFPGPFEVQIFRTDGADFFSSATGIWSLSQHDDGRTSSWDSVAVVATPLPGALPLFATGLAGLAWIARRSRRQTS
jgi:hypothetical protein